MEHGFEEVLGPFILRVFEDVFWFALFLDDAVGHEDDPVGDFFGEGHFVGDDDHGHVFVGELFDGPQDFAGQFRVQGVVGSSKSMMSGSMARARAMATRCCWPPERRDG